MAEKKKMLYVQTSGIDTPKRLYSPFVLGMTAQAMDIDATIYFRQCPECGGKRNRHILPYRKAK